MSIQQYEPVGHPGAIVALILAWSGYLAPLLTALATVASLVWFAICIWESSTIQHWKNNLIMRHRARKLARLKARELKVQASITAIELLRSARTDAKEVVAAAAADAARLLAHEPVQNAAKKVEGK